MPRLTRITRILHPVCQPLLKGVITAQRSQLDESRHYVYRVSKLQNSAGGFLAQDQRDTIEGDGSGRYGSEGSGSNFWLMSLRTTDWKASTTQAKITRTPCQIIGTPSMPWKIMRTRWKTMKMVWKTSSLTYAENIHVSESDFVTSS